jgi:hypothetical protein
MHDTPLKFIILLIASKKMPSNVNIATIMPIYKFYNRLKNIDLSIARN